MGKDSERKNWSKGNLHGISSEYNNSICLMGSADLACLPVLVTPSSIVQLGEVCNTGSPSSLYPIDQLASLCGYETVQSLFSKIIS